jgi:beta-lactamase class A
MGVKELLAAVEGKGDFSVWLGGLDGRAAFAHDAARLHYSASTMKLPVAIAMMRAVDDGRLTLDQPVTVHDDFDSAYEGERFTVQRGDDDAPATWDHLGSRVPLRWLAEQMITLSSNLATDLTLELTGVPAADRALADALGNVDGERSVLRRGIDDRPAQLHQISNLMSAADFAAVLIAVGNDTAASPSSCAYLRDLLAANGWNDQIPAGLPAGVRVEHKNGWDIGIRHDAGIVRPPDAEPFVLSVFTTSELADDAAQRLIADIAAVVWEHRHDLGGVA